MSTAGSDEWEVVAHCQLGDYWQMDALINTASKTLYTYPPRSLAKARKWVKGSRCLYVTRINSRTGIQIYVSRVVFVNEMNSLWHLNYSLYSDSYSVLCGSAIIHSDSGPWYKRCAPHNYSKAWALTAMAVDHLCQKHSHVCQST